jgi:hypothetical protein
MTVTDEQIAELLQDPVAHHDFVLHLETQTMLGNAFDATEWYQHYVQGDRIDPEYLKHPELFPELQ